MVYDHQYWQNGCVTFYSNGEFDREIYMENFEGFVVSGNKKSIP